MLSFALAFHAVFHTCGTYDQNQCPGDDDENPLSDAFGTFGDAFVTVFASALGGPDFSIFEAEGSYCRCELPDGAKTAGIFLLVVSDTAFDDYYGRQRPNFHTCQLLCPS